MPPERTLRILYMEDNPADAEVVMRELAVQGVPAVWTRVASRGDFVRALDEQTHDLIISNYSMPSFSGDQSLAVAREKRPGVPFVFVSGTIGEERAVEALLQGATDYVLKDRLFRLGVVVRRAMRDSALRAQKTLVEKQLHATVVQMQRLLAASPAVIYATPFPPGATASFVSENVRKWFGYDPEDLTDRPDFWFSRVHPDDRHIIQTRLEGLLATEPGPISYRFMHADGRYRWVEDHMNTVRDDGGMVREIVGSWVDTTDVKQLQQDMTRMREQFHQAQKMEAIGSLAGGVAHDFNNILMIILSYCSFLEMKLPRDSPLHRELVEITKAGKRAADLTHQLLAFSRKGTLNPRRINPSEAVRNTSKMLARLVGENIRLSLKITTDQADVLCDPSQLDQILINLVVNSRDAMQGGGEITIETSVTAAAVHRAEHATGEAPTEVCISITDTGAGMSQETMERMFEPFFTTKPAGKGTGLGLSVVYGAVQQNKGRITVESELGKGTSVRIYFRRLPEEDMSAKAPATTREPGVGRRTILLVEDLDTVRRATRSLLEGLGFTVIEAANAEEGLAIHGRRAGSIDIVLTDVVMPGMSGPELARRIRSVQPDVRIIFCTGYLENIETVGRDLGGGSIMIQKPFDGAEFLQKIQSLFPAPQSPAPA